METVEGCVNPKNEWKITPLHYAAQKGHLAVYQLIIGTVNDKNPNEAEITPLYYAADNGHFDIYANLFWFLHIISSFCEQKQQYLMCFLPFFTGYLFLGWYMLL